MGGQDKGLLVLHNQPLIYWVIQALPASVRQRVISCNRHLDIYARYGEVVADQPSDTRYAGALAGLLAGLPYCKCDWVLVAPCDLVHYPTGFVDVAWHALSAHLAAHPHAARIAVAHDGERRQNLCLLVHRDEAAGIAEALKTSHAVHHWLSARQALDIPWLDQRAFMNINDPVALQAEEQHLT